MTRPAPPLAAQDLSFSYEEGAAPLFRGVSFALQPGEWLALTGSSGCGKSTLCLLLSGVIPRSRDEGVRSGRVWLKGVDIETMPLSELASTLGLVLQEPDSQLFAPLIEDELAFGPENLCCGREEIDLRIREALAVVGLSDLRGGSTEALSGGQKQLIALAATIACRPQVLLLDEAFSMLDAAAAERLHKAVRLMQQQGTAILAVEHEPSRLAWADRVLKLSGGQLQEVGGC